MTTLRTRAFVSLLLALPLGACTSRTIGTSAGRDTPSPTSVHPLAIRFTNEGRERVHVYLVGAKREWLLGRVEPGATAWLPLPVRALTHGAGTVQLAVLANTPLNLQAARDPRAVVTLAQPASSLMDRQWSFVQGQLVSLLPQRR